MVWVKKEDYKSRGEKLIADFLRNCGIKCLYEYPLVIQDEDKKVRLWYPDFWLPELSVVVEYFGMVNDAEYKKHMFRKEKIYRRLNIDFIGLRSYTVQMDKNWEKAIIMQLIEIMDSKDPIYRKLLLLKKKYTWKKDEEGAKEPTSKPVHNVNKPPARQSTKPVHNVNKPRPSHNVNKPPARQTYNVNRPPPRQTKPAAKPRQKQPIRKKSTSTTRKKTSLSSRL